MSTERTPIGFRGDLYVQLKSRHWLNLDAVRRLATCDKCGAKPAEPCVTTRGYHPGTPTTTHVHRGRRDLTVLRWFRLSREVGTTMMLSWGRLRSRFRYRRGGWRSASNQRLIQPDIKQIPDGIVLPEAP